MLSFIIISISRIVFFLSLFSFFLFFFLFLFFLKTRRDFPPVAKFSGKELPVFPIFPALLVSMMSFMIIYRRTIWRNMSKHGIQIIHPLTLLQFKAASHSPYSRRIYHYHHVQRCSLYGLASLLKHPPVLAHCHHFVTNL